MARSRLIRPEFWSDEKLARLSRDSRLLYIGMWLTSDDYGVTKGSPAWLRSQVFPYDEDIKMARFQEWIAELEKLRRVLPFTVDGEKYYYIPKFSEHQKVDKPSKNRNPSPPDDIDSRVSSESVASDSRESSDETETETEFKQKQNTPSIDVGGFDRFWAAYPKKVGKLEARRAWSRLNGTRPTTDAIVSKIDTLKKSEQWTREGGRFIPNPATWLNRGGWDDEIKQTKSGVEEWIAKHSGS